MGIPKTSAAALIAIFIFVCADRFVTLVASVANVQILSASSWQPYLGWHIWHPHQTHTQTFTTHANTHTMESEHQHFHSPTLNKLLLSLYISLPLSFDYCNAATFTAYFPSCKDQPTELEQKRPTNAPNIYNNTERENLFAPFFSENFTLSVSECVCIRKIYTRRPLFRR